MVVDPIILALILQIGLLLQVGMAVKLHVKIWVMIILLEVVSYPLMMEGMMARIFKNKLIKR